MPSIFWTFLDVELWLPDRWVAVDDFLIEIADTIDRHNNSFADRETYLLKRIRWTPWGTLTVLWHREWIALRGSLTYRDPQPQIIEAVVSERSAKNFSYDGDRMRHLPTGDVWYAIEVVANEVLTGAAPTAPDVGNTPWPPPDADPNDPWTYLRLRNRRKVEPPEPPAPTDPAASAAETPAPANPPERATPRRGRPTKKQLIVDAFDGLPAEVVRDAKSLAGLCPIIRENIPGSLKANGEPAEGFENKTLRGHLGPLFREHRAALRAAMLNNQK